MAILDKFLSICGRGPKSPTQRRIAERQKEVGDVLASKLMQEGKSKIEEGVRTGNLGLKREGEKLLKRALAVKSGEMSLLKAIGAIDNGDG